MAEYIEDAEDMVHLHLNATQNVLLSHDLIFSVIAAVSAVSDCLQWFSHTVPCQATAVTLLVELLIFLRSGFVRLVNA